tara:strand:+ start:596 stop:1231 length:636 start_codon:yes stop_codon:yes gene_type:complete
MLDKLRPKNISANGGFSLIEVISVLSIISILVSITYPSLRRYFIQIERDSYLAKLNSFLEQIKRETRRYGISCDLKTIEIINFKSEVNSISNDIKPFQLDCYGSDEIINNLRFEVPKITKNIFQFVSGDLTFTPKGQVYVNNKRNFGNSYVVVVGLKEQSNGFNDSLRCLLVNPPIGVIDNGIYITKYKTQYDYGVSRYNSFLVDRFCSKK